MAASTPLDPACESCGYSLKGLGVVAAPVTCPKCGAAQILGSDPPPRPIGVIGMATRIVAPWILIPIVAGVGPIGLLAPPLISFFVALGYSERFLPTLNSAAWKQILAAGFLWVLVNGGIGAFFLGLFALR